MSSANRIGSPFLELLSVDSTNNYAMGLVHAGMAQHGLAVFATTQTQGRGQRQKAWLSEPGANIALSLVLQPAAIPLSQLFLLSQCVAVAVHRFFSRYAPGDLALKWPNDLYWRDRKAGGILIENLIQGGRWRFAVAGIGINVNQVQFPGLDTQPVSLRQITGKTADPGALARELCEAAEEAYQLVQTRPDEIRRYYHDHLYKRDETVRLRCNGRVFDALIRGVSETGELVAEAPLEERYGVGEVEWIL